MRAVTSWIVLGFLLLIVCAGSASAKTDLAKYDADATAELRAIAPEAVPAWEQANQARDANDAAKAVELYTQVLAQAPGFHHALRRRCGAELMLDKLGDAHTDCAAALAAADVPENRAALARVLLAEKRPEDLSRARQLAERAVADAPKDEHIRVVLCQVLLQAESEQKFYKCARVLQRLDPDGLEANIYGALADAGQGYFDAARADAERAHQAGLPDDAYGELVKLIDTAETESRRYQDDDDSGSIMPSVGFLKIAGLVLAAWLGSLLLLFCAGALLSAAALRAANRGPGGLRAEATPGEQRLRTIYRRVLWLSGLYFYLSVPIILAVVVAFGGGLLWLIVASGHIPVKLVLIIGVVVVVTVASIVKGLFARADDSDPGVGLDPASHPRLRALLDEVAVKVGSPRVDAVFMTPGTDLAVFERGGMMRQLRGGSQRCLILGLGVLEGMRQDEFKSVLAHEHGHLRNADTAGGGLALAVRRAMYGMLRGLAESGAATAWNPAWWFLRGYHRVFLRISQGASRVQEVLADRWAALAYGSAAFERGYRHVVAQSVRFDAHVDATVKEVLEHDRPLLNLYTYQPSKLPDMLALEQEIAAALARDPGPYDSHPAPQQRLAWVAAMAAPAAPAAGDDQPVWALFENAEALQRRVTQDVRENLAINNGVHIAGLDPAAQSS